jgi:hypothetical protein
MACSALLLNYNDKEQRTMQYINAKDILPQTLLMQIQQYVRGKVLYIPQYEDEKETWGGNTGIKSKLLNRNSEIRNKKLKGATIDELMLEYHLSYDTIKRIVYTR